MEIELLQIFFGTSVTRNGKFSPLWQVLQFFGNFREYLILNRKNFEPALASYNSIVVGKWPRIDQIILSSGYIESEPDISKVSCQPTIGFSNKYLSGRFIWASSASFQFILVLSHNFIEKIVDCGAIRGSGSKRNAGIACKCSARIFKTSILGT